MSGDKRQLSMQPEAKRKRDYRARKAATTVVATGTAAASSGQATPHRPDAPAAPVATLWDTVPVHGPGAESFASVPLIDDSTPFVPPDAEPAPGPATPEDVALVSNGVALYFQVGFKALIEKYPQLVSLVPGGAPVLDEHFPAVVMLVRRSAENEAMRLGIKLPHQDLIITGAALGVATFGLFGPEPKNGNKGPKVVRDVPRDAKDANPTTDADMSPSHEPSAVSSADEEPS